MNSTLIHASCKKNYASCVERLVPLREWKFIENFSLTSASGHYHVIGQVINVKDIEIVQVNGKERKILNSSYEIANDGLSLTIVEPTNDEEKMVKKK
ncbi:unnamed protein product [Thlaspi arvense]|uniref:Uncharacterized protein n=1 Tax=Thlaspi arvense TaxID=13288 RepID=A0AAU9SPQ0_THLAR|nr:unnamed protein product [Thlaspi arvense]